MTPEEAIEIMDNEYKRIELQIMFLKGTTKKNIESFMYRIDVKESLKTAIYALKEIQQYRKIGTVEEIKKAKACIKLLRRIKTLEGIMVECLEYEKIGTVEECQEAREKQIPKKPVCKPKPYNESVGFNEEWFCPSCGAYIGYFYEGMDEPEQMEYCNECGQHIARDWSDKFDDE